MRIIAAETLRDVLDYPALIAVLKRAFTDSTRSPGRHHHTIEVPGGPDATLLLMPAWTPGGYLGVKAATIYPSNLRREIPTVSASYLLMDGSTGEGLAILDGRTLTAMRTGAASALASSFLSRPEARVFLMIGAGALAEPLVRAHAAVRSFSRILLWNRSGHRAEVLHRALGNLPCSVERVENLDRAIGESDVISCATLSRDPLVRGSNVKPGTHVDLVGAYRADMRESDDQLIVGASVFVIPGRALLVRLAISCTPLNTEPGAWTV